VVNWCHLHLVFDIASLYRGKPFITKSRDAFHNHSPHNLKLRFHKPKVILRKNIAVSVDFSNADEVALNSAFELGGLMRNIR
jgi:manganese transport protein